MEEEKIILDLSSFKEQGMRQMILTTDQIELNVSLIVDNEFFSQNFQNMKNLKKSLAHLDDTSFYEYVEDKPNLELGVNIKMPQTKDEILEQLDEWDNQDIDISFYYTQINIKPDNFEFLFLDQEKINNTKQDDDSILNRQQLFQKILNDLQKEWQLYAQLAELIQEQGKQIIFNLNFQPPSKNCKIASIKSINKFFEKVIQDFLFNLQNFKGDIKLEKIQISSNFGDIFLQLSKQESREAAFKSLRTFQRTIPPCVPKIFFYSNQKFKKLHDQDSVYLGYLRDLQSIKVLKTSDINIIIGGGAEKELKEQWGGEDQGFVIAQMVFFKMLKRINYAKANKVDPSDQQQNYTVGTINN